MDKPKDVEAYLANVEPWAQRIVEALRQPIKETVPGAVEGISYGVPFYKYHGSFVGIAVYKNHVSFGYGYDLLTEESKAYLKAEGYHMGKETLQIKSNQAIPAEVIRQILLAKAEVNERQQ